MRTLVRGDLLVRLPWFLTLLGAFLVFWADRSSSSYTWRLDLDVGKVIVNENDVDDDRDEGDSEDEKRGDTIFNIVMTTVTDVDGTWKKTAKEKAKRGSESACTLVFNECALIILLSCSRFEGDVDELEEQPRSPGGRSRKLRLWRRRRGR